MRKCILSASKMERARSLVQTQKPINLLYRIKANEKRKNYFRLMPLLFSHCIYKRISRHTLYTRLCSPSLTFTHILFIHLILFEVHIIKSTWNSISCCVRNNTIWYGEHEWNLISLDEWVVASTISSVEFSAKKNGKSKVSEVKIHLFSYCRVRFYCRKWNEQKE